jgi:hypothetical protein
VTGRRGRRRKQLLNGLKETRRYWKLKDEEPDHTVWRTGFGRNYGPIIRQSREWMNEWMNGFVKCWPYRKTLRLFWCWTKTYLLNVHLFQLGFFTYYTVAMGGVNPSGPVPIDSVFIYRPDKRLEVWRFLFYMVLHAG